MNFSEFLNGLLKAKRRGTKWTVSDMHAALYEISKGLLTQRAASKKYNIPRRTLRDHIGLFPLRRFSSLIPTCGLMNRCLDSKNLE